MNDRKHILGAVGAFFGVVLVGSLLLAWPNLRQVRAIAREIEDLHLRSEALDGLLARVGSLEQRLRSAKWRVEHELRSVPDSPDLAEAMRRLSLPVDNERVVDQTFTAGAAFAALSVDELAALKGDDGIEGGGEDAPGSASLHALPVPMAMPLTIEVVGTFDTVFGLLTSVETMDRLVRIASVRMVCDRSERNSNRFEPLLNASIGLEAVFAPRE